MVAVRTTWTPVQARHRPARPDGDHDVSDVGDLVEELVTRPPVGLDARGAGTAEGDAVHPAAAAVPLDPAGHLLGRLVAGAHQLGPGQLVEQHVARSDCGA